MTLDRYVFGTLMRDLVGHDKSPSSYLIFLYLWDQARAEGAKTIQVSYSKMAFATGLSKSAVQRGVKNLLRRKLISQTKRSRTAVPCYQVRTPWVRRKKD